MISRVQIYRRAGTPNLAPRMELPPRQKQAGFSVPAVPFPEIPRGQIKTLVGNHAVSYAVEQAFRAYSRGLVAVFPITPQTEAAHRLIGEIYAGRVPGWALTPPSEHATASAAMTAALCGVPVWTATSSVGAAHMAEMLIAIAANVVPVNGLFVNRAFAPLNIWEGAVDRDLFEHHGLVQLVSVTQQDAYRNQLLGFEIANRTGLPVFNNMAGFITSHTAAPVRVLGKEAVQSFLTTWNPRRNLWRDTQTVGQLTSPTAFPLQRGQAHEPYQEVLRDDFRRTDLFEGSGVGGVFQQVSAEYNKLTGETSTGPFKTYRCEGAKKIFLTFSFLAGDLADYVDILRSRGERVGLVSGVLFRPFGYRELAELLRQQAPDVEVIGVFEDNLNPGKPVIYRDVQTSLAEHWQDLGGERLPRVIVGTFEGGQHPDLSVINAVYERMRQIGKTGQVENFRYRLDEESRGPSMPLAIDGETATKVFGHRTSILVLGRGGQGAVSGAGSIVEIINARLKDAGIEATAGDLRNFTAEEAQPCGEVEAQGSSQYGSEKTGTPTYAMINISNKPIRSAKSSGPRDVIIALQENLIKPEHIAQLKEDSVLIVNTRRSPSEIRRRHNVPESVEIHTVNATKIARDCLGEDKPFGSTAAILSGLRPDVLRKKEWLAAIERSFRKKGAKLLEGNMLAVEWALIYSEYERTINLLNDSKNSGNQETEGFSLTTKPVAGYPSFTLKIGDELQIVSTDGYEFKKTQAVLSEKLIDLNTLIDPGSHRINPVTKLFEKGSVMRPEFDPSEKIPNQETLVVNTAKPPDQIRSEHKVPNYVRIVTIDAKRVMAENKVFISPLDVLSAAAAIDRPDLIIKEVLNATISGRPEDAAPDLVAVAGSYAQIGERKGEAE